MPHRSRGRHGGKREIAPRARKRRGDILKSLRAFDAPTFEEDERELPLGGDDKPPSGA